MAKGTLCALIRKAAGLNKGAVRRAALICMSLVGRYEEL
jgi:hypothetical protein